MARPTAVMEAIYVGRMEYSRLSEVAPLVFKAAAAHDQVAEHLIEELADEVVANAIAAIRRLHLTRQDVHVVLGGGVLRAAGPKLLARISDGVRAVAPNALIRQLEAPPLLGAALIGLDLMAAPARAYRRLRQELDGELGRRLPRGAVNRGGP
jgi:N-acetylglucosamine kinase-like BadF-type ATPase